MKKLVLALSCLTLLAACGKGNSSNGQPVDPGQGYAAVDLPPECQQAAPTALPYEYETAGCSPYKWSNGRFRNNGCPRNTFAACATGAGMICVPRDVYDSHQVAWYNYQDGNRRSQFCGYQGQYDRGTCSYRAIPGAGTIGRACIVGANDCGFGRCQPLNMRRDDDRRPNRRNRGLGRRGGPSQMRQIGICVQ